MPVIYCRLNLFDAKQTVQLVDDVASSELASVEMSELGHTIATLCNDNEVFSVKIAGNPSSTLCGCFESYEPRRLKNQRWHYLS